jgi:pyoverdine/dityrosine biosynthesis protein Dit1
MIPKEFIEYRLSQLKPTNKTIPKEELVDFIYKTIMSKKFRKYSANQELVNHIKKSIEINIQNNQPINFVFPHGAYKLWRLEESPLPDCAELFTSIYYTKWLKPICEVYKPGVLFEYFVDDLILPIMNNTPIEDVEAYLDEYRKMLDFLKKYQPENFKIVITRFQDKFKDKYQDVEKFNVDLKNSIEKISKTNPIFTEEQLRRTELNAKPTEKQLKDTKWRENIRLIHDAYMSVKRELGYYYKLEKIPVFCQNLPSGKFVVVGTTKTSVAKFWVGVGALKKQGNEFIEYILSPQQLETSHFTKESISIKGLDSKNFKTIRIIA